MVSEPNESAALIIQIVFNLVIGAFGASPLVALIVGLVKKTPGFENWQAPNITFLVAGVLWLAVAIGSYIGHESEVRDVITLLEKIMPPIVAFVATLIGAPEVHEAAAKRDVAIVGSKRTPPTERKPDVIVGITSEG